MNSGFYNDLESGWHDGILEIVSAAKKSGFVIYGTGAYGKLTYDIFRLWDLTPLCFADDSALYHTQGLPFETGIPVLSLDEAAARYPDAVFIRADNSQYAKIQGLSGIVETKTKNLIKLGLCGKYSRFQPLRYKFLLLYAAAAGVDKFDDIVKTLDGVCIRADQFDWRKINSVIFQSFVNVSGSFMFAQLCDGHPQILSLPLIIEAADRLEIGLASAYLFRLRRLNGLSLAIELMAQIAFLIKDCESIDWFLDAEGNSATENIQLPSIILFKALYAQVNSRDRFSFGDLFKAVHCAYANASGKTYNQNLKYYIYYHVHAFGLRGLYWRELFDEVYCINTIREPVRSTFSFIRRVISNYNLGIQYNQDQVDDIVLYSTPFYWLNKHNDGFYHFLRFCNLDTCEKGYTDTPTRLALESTLEEKIGFMADAALDLIENSNVYFVKFEDLKLRLEETMRAMCETLHIEFDPILLETTANGVKIYESTKYISNERRTAPVDQNDKTSLLSPDYMKYMSEYDIERTKIIFKEVAHYLCYGEYPVKSFSDLTDGEKVKLFNEPYKLQIDCDPQNNHLSEYAYAHDMASAAIFKNVIRQLREKGKNYLISPLENTANENL